MILIVFVILFVVIVGFYLNTPKAPSGSSSPIGPNSANVQITFYGISANSYGFSATISPILGNLPSPIVYATIKGVAGSIVAQGIYNFGSTVVAQDTPISANWNTGTVGRGTYTLVLYATDQSGNAISSITSQTVSF